MKSGMKSVTNNLRTRSVEVALVFLLLFVSDISAAGQQGGQSSTASSTKKQSQPFEFEQIIGHIEALENVSDPKCYATASRLEDFIYGTPLEDSARFTKNQLQKQWLMNIWKTASDLAIEQQLDEVSSENVLEATAPVLVWTQLPNQHWQVALASQKKESHNTQGDEKSNTLTIHKDDKRQYGSIAYSLRSLLAVQQEILLNNTTEQFLPLDDAATDILADALDFYLLSVLQITDREARSKGHHEVDETLLVNVWNTLFELQHREANTAKKTYKVINPVLLNQVVEQKVRSYAQYNHITNQLFVRNLQVFFARLRWPEKGAQATQFRQLFTEEVIAFAGDLYRGAQQRAMDNNHNLILESDVYDYAQSVLPHTINEYEDAVFFPKLKSHQRVTIEAYDMDAFRDSGVHWRYLQFALNDHQFPTYLEPDPFALELIVENIAQYGVLILRVTGNIGIKNESTRIKPEHLKDAVSEVFYFARENNLVEETAAELSLLSATSNASARTTNNTVSASANSNEQQPNSLFSDVTVSSGVNVMHRSSDWLSRLLRSYLISDKGVGNIVIPPAFGGSGIAAGDINNDGHDDLLLLSGLGNKLYVNDGKGHFTDVTQKAGLRWVRAQDNQPGEPRQPIIADLDNDGWQDILITYVNDLHRVYRNKGDGTFDDVTATAGLGGESLVGGPATVFDYDGDGLLDVYITYFGNYLEGVLPTLKRRNTNGSPNKLFRNIGKFKFQDTTAGSGLDNVGWGQAVTHTDFNGDGKPDLIVGNDFGVNSYYENTGNGKFVDVATKFGTDKPSYTMGIGLGDLNQDRVSDIYISNIVTMNKDEKYVLPSQDTTMKFNPDKLAKMRVVEANDLFMSKLSQEADGGAQELTFSQSAKVGRGYSATGWSWDADFFDYDNDGDDDLYVLNGMNDFNVYSRENPYYKDPGSEQSKNVLFAQSNKEKNTFFINDGGNLNNESEISGLDYLSNDRSATYLDMDGDGDLDIVTLGYHEPARVIKNNAETNSHNWLKVALNGAPSKGINKDAIGAKVIVISEDGWSRTRELSGTIGYMSVHSKVLHFGLAHHKKVNIEVIWPNGEIAIVKDITANQHILIDYLAQQK